MRVGRRSVLGLGLAAGFAGAARASGSAPPVQTDVRAGGGGGLAAAADDVARYAAQHVSAYGLPGLTLCVVGPEGFVAQVRVGYANVERGEPVEAGHLFQIGSISKSITALAVYRLMEAGKLKLEDDPAKLLPGAPLPPKSGITIRHLLDHSSGLPDDAPLFPRSGGGRLWQGYAPGSHWSYSNLGYEILGRIVVRLSGKPLPDALAELVLRPLGMTATRPAILSVDRAAYAEPYSQFYLDRAHPRAGRLGHAPWTDMTEGAGCVASTASDMALYVRWLIRAGAGGEAAPLLSKDAAARWFAATVDAPGWSDGARYGAGLAHVPIGGRTLLHHTGGMIGYSSSIHVDPQAGVGCFASSNVGGIDYRPRQVTAWACQRMLAALTGAAAPPPPPAPPPPAPAGDVLGRWVARDGSAMSVAAGAGGAILVAHDGAPPARLEAVAPDVFVHSDPERGAYPLVFRRQGKAPARAWWGGVEYLPDRGAGPVGAYSPATPPALARLVGAYENDDPWTGVFHVTAEGPQLFLDGLNPVTPLPGGGFRVGEEAWSPERLSFDAEIDGVPKRATFSGRDFLRRPL